MIPSHEPFNRFDSNLLRMNHPRCFSVINETDNQLIIKA